MAEITPKARKFFRKVSEYVLFQHKQGKSSEQIVSQLVEKGIEKEPAEKLVGEILKAAPQLREKNIRFAQEAFGRNLKFNP